MARTPFTIRPARADEAAALTALCVRAKGHWGYDAAFMEMSARALAVSAADIEAGVVWVAVDGGDAPLGVAELAVVDTATADLDKLFVDPGAMGAGVGAALLRFVAAEAGRGGRRVMTVLADPNAAPFYERMGARFQRMAPSDSIPGRELPLYVFDVGGPP
ncbi:MAG: GNAT family N-acetyltransferase [Rhodospirillales bacterium]|nr:MAG: GNAT family N-acetyltransferase [Rhodospirillales bacterium]